MNVQFHPPSGRFGNKGSSQDVAAYMNKEDLKKLKEGNMPELFFNRESDTIFTTQVIQGIDKNTAQLHKEDARFYFLSISPSEKELAAMGNTREEQAKGMKEYINLQFINEYAEHFKKKGINADSIKYYAKLHHERKGEKNDLHCHIIISHKDKDNKRMISPMSNAKDSSTNKSFAKSGFDRNEFFRKVDSCFDKQFEYKRDIRETFDYCYTMKNGSQEERAELIEKTILADVSQGPSEGQIQTIDKNGEVVNQPVANKSLPGIKINIDSVNVFGVDPSKSMDEIIREIDEHNKRPGFGRGM